MFRSAIMAATCASTALVAWHHVGWPLVLRAAARRPSCVPAPLADADLPTVRVVVPAHDEEAHVAAKLRNLAALDYPPDRLRVTLACDGCGDRTVGAAHEALGGIASASPGGLDAEVLDLRPNRGKLAVLQEIIHAAREEIILLTDVSAMLPPSALRLLAAHLAESGVGAAGIAYGASPDADAGERVYWALQIESRRGEAALGAPIGMHGACWAFRREAWRPIPADTINDDFVMPMQMLGDGWALRYETRAVAWEADGDDRATEARRRMRIAAGNAQQLARMPWLLDPRIGGPALAFASGKALRVAMPFLMATAGAGATVLASGSLPFAILAASGAAVLAAAAAGGRPDAAGPLRVARYVVAGHVNSARGVMGWLRGDFGTPWGRAAAAGPTAPHPCHVPPSVRAAKRASDVVIASLALVAALPFVPLIALAIRLDSPGPVVFRQMRIGRAAGDRTEVFMMRKFRTMRTDAETVSGAVWAKKGDPRVTRVGAFLRKTRLDEIPQLLNVLAGDMSIVGPRPERPGFYRRLESQIPFFSERTVGIRPGITGLAQVRQGYDTCVEDVRRKVAMDHAYALRLRSLREWAALDAWIAFRTLAVMVLGRGQ
jgi:lipopolysaccharide/colanic/teichoic acid biosynthesis glycosyltransferase